MLWHQPLSDEQVRQILARAAELESRAACGVSLTQLRSIAEEVGIPLPAFYQAVRELADEPATANPAAARRWRAGLAAPLAALGTFTGAQVLVIQVSRLLGLEWEARTLGELLALALGTAVAHRLGTKSVKITLLGIAAGEAVGLLAHILFGNGFVLSGVTLATLAGTGVLAAGLATRLARHHGSTNGSAEIQVPLFEEDRWIDGGDQDLPSSWDNRLLMGTAV